MRTEDVNAQAAANWPDIAARDKIAFFVADVSKREGGEPVLTYTACFPDASVADLARDEAWRRVQDKFGELAAAIREAVAPTGRAAEVRDARRPATYSETLPTADELEAASKAAMRLACNYAAAALAARQAHAPAQESGDATAFLSVAGSEERAGGRAPLAPPVG